MMYRVIVTETARNTPKDLERSRIFNEDVQHFHTVDELNDFFLERYDSIPNKRWAKIYRGEGIQCGYCRSFWNKDYSHNTKSYWQTDWIEISVVEEEVYLFKTS